MERFEAMNRSTSWDLSLHLSSSVLLPLLVADLAFHFFFFSLCERARKRSVENSQGIMGFFLQKIGSGWRDSSGDDERVCCFFPNGEESFEPQTLLAFVGLRPINQAFWADTMESTTSRCSVVHSKSASPIVAFRFFFFFFRKTGYFSICPLCEGWIEIRSSGVHFCTGLCVPG